MWNPVDRMNAQLKAKGSCGSPSRSDQRIGGFVPSPSLSYEEGKEPLASIHRLGVLLAAIDGGRYSFGFSRLQAWQGSLIWTLCNAETEYNRTCQDSNGAKMLVFPQ